MVEDTGKTLRAGAYRAVNLPEPVRVREDASGLPLALQGKGQSLRGKITAVDDCWRIDDEWWRADPVSRLYYSVRVASGNRLVLYRDLATGEWYKQSY
jgi:hypothetical protein